MVVSQHDCRWWVPAIFLTRALPHHATYSPIDQRRQFGCPRLRWRAYHSSCDVRRDTLRLQDCTRLRVLELDPILHRLPDRSWRICALWQILKLAHGRWEIRGRRHPLFRCIRLRFRFRMDKLRIRLHMLSAPWH